MTFWRMPLLVWANFTTSTARRDRDAVHRRLAVLRHVRPRHAHELLRASASGGYVLGYQHIFWFYSHPAVYIMMLPGFGIISEIISVMSRKPIFGYRLMALSLMAILVLGFSVWAHHMFVAGMAPLAARADDGHVDGDRGADRDQGVLVARDDVGRATSTSRRRCCSRLGFISMFVIGGLSGIYLGVGADRHPRERHVLHRRAHPLRALRRLGLHDLRRASTTGSRR